MMLLRIRKPLSLPDSAVTPEMVYRQRRQVLAALGLGAGLMASPASAGLFGGLFGGSRKTVEAAPRRELDYRRHDPAPELTLTPHEQVTTYNNFYEFGTDKADPARNSQSLRIEPWTLQVAGEVARPGTVDVWSWLEGAELEERIYRMRCVEGWSMVIPWVGTELGKLLQSFEPTSRAKYVAFETLYDPEQMPGQSNRRMGGGIDYPYVEGLRIDEAMHPLTLLAVGLYGKTLPNQNGAPVRLVVPWKYGFKSIKSIVAIRLLEEMPPTTWNLSAPHEYGFYANVNPEVDHPRWSQASERVIDGGSILSARRQPTLMFNGYGEEVAQLYRGMDLRRYF